jgi:hypothetical protein
MGGIFDYRKPISRSYRVDPVEVRREASDVNWNERLRARR